MVNEIYTQLQLPNFYAKSVSASRGILPQKSKKNNLDLYNHFLHYDRGDYLADIEQYGLEQTWMFICDYLLQYGEKKPFLYIENFGEMYEQGLAISNKHLKKENGQYYTPRDVSLLMADLLLDEQGENVCDVACGTGNLILAYLEKIGKRKAHELLKSGRIYLYDEDAIALRICKTSLLVKYGNEFESKIHAICGNFLHSSVVLPSNSKVISNPPYGGGKEQLKSLSLQHVKEIYAAFLEKIARQSMAAVVITPFSFISSSTFYPLRLVLNARGGEIFSFDNVPGNIFHGKKQGIFNTNKSNSVRAAITVIHSLPERGFKVTPLIRFKTEERTSILNKEILKQFLPSKKQFISHCNTQFCKCDPRLEDIYAAWLKVSQSHCLEELTVSGGPYLLAMPNTCRYYTTACIEKMERKGQILLYFDDLQKLYYVFCLLNSSFAYWYWRMFDGAITYPRGLLLKLPVFFHQLSAENHLFFQQQALDMIDKTAAFKITKQNIGIQENIKYPVEYRNKINQYILDIMQLPISAEIFDVVHANKAL